MLRRYVDQGAYTDCYAAEVDGTVSLPEFVEAFYTTPLFKVERAILRWCVARPSSDVEARRLAGGTLDSFAAWRVEGRAGDQLLLGDFTGRTKSWLMVAPAMDAGAGVRTRLHFGSAVVPLARAGDGERRMGLAFHALQGFHQLYSRLLLGAACSRVARVERADAG
ncbi:MAG: hypothetical protein HYS20_09035 [Rhodocyclales bacterium]|nr:hypothetical protein [Rhodocyclales bacterium]